jgi:hypothetical protein
MTDLPENLLDALRQIRDSEASVANRLTSKKFMSDNDLDRLREEGFLSFTGKRDGSGKYNFVMNLTVTGKGLRIIGVWPSAADPVAADAIHKAAEHANDPEEKSKLRAFSEAASEVGKNTMAGVLTAVLVAAPSLLR